MATGTITKPIKSAIVVEEITVISGGADSAYYKLWAKSCAKEGYTPIGIIQAELNQVSVYFYRLTITGSEVQAGVCKASNSGSLSSISIKVKVLYIRNDLI